MLFDAVGTLLRLREPVGATYARLAAEHGARVPAGRLEEAFARCRAAAGPVGYAPGQALAEAAALERGWWRRLVDDTFRAADGAAVPRPFDAFFERLFAHYGTAAAWELAPGAEACLRELRARGVATAVVSNFDLRLPGRAAGPRRRRAPRRRGAPRRRRRREARRGRSSRRPASGSASPRRRRPSWGTSRARTSTGARAAGLRAVDAGALATLVELPAALGLPPLATEPR